MAVSWPKLLAAIQEHKDVGVHFRGSGYHLTHKFKRADLRRLVSPTEEYKIKEIRHLVAQLGLDKDIIRKHIAEL